MKIFSPGSMVRLWILYQENGVAVSGLTNLTVTGIDNAGNTVLAEQQLTEVAGTGEYFYNWNTAGIALETVVRVFYRMDDDVLYDEEYLIENIEDDDGRAF
ncbi:MAG TPA: hypothetical protein PKM65_20375 [Spirochaetota bacterium]|nr:hypothetical protein [Spirochaetota bacterium]